ncbi:transposase, partial [Membranicola marinus]
MRTDYHASLQPQGVYHFYNKTVSQRKLFYDHKDYTRFLNKFKKYFTAYMDIVAYCLIPNHFHFMVKVKTISPIIRKLIAKEKTQAAFKFLSNEDTFNEFLSDQFRRFLSGHSLYINHKYDIQGSLLLKKTKRTAVVTDTKLYDLLCYIHHNPIHHGLTIT